MNVTGKFAAPLQGVRVVDISDNKAAYCSKLLADLGAEVIRVEDLHAMPTPCEGPFLDNVPDCEHSLSYWYENSGKLSVSLDLSRPKDRDSFIKLVDTADLLIESCPAGYLEGLHLGYDVLRQNNPALSMVSVTGFGRTGPGSRYKSSDILASAAGGQMYVCGRPGRPPLKPYGNQSYYLVSLLGAIGSLLSLLGRDKYGRGQQVDLSLQEAVASALEHVLVQYLYNNVVPRRQGSLQWNFSSDLFPCRDGYILLTFNREWEPLVEILDQQGMAADLTHPAWHDEEFRKKHIDDIEEVLTNWTCRQDSRDIFRLGQAMRFPWAVLNTIAEVAADEQLESRGFFEPARHPLAENEFRVPRPVINFKDAPAYTYQRAPAPGEHSCRLDEIIATGRRPEVTGSAGDPAGRPPLEGIRVLDFTWMLAGPYATRMLADFGAEVIKVQSKLTATGAENNGTGYFAAWNRNKLGITLDMSRPEARGLALELAATCDVVMENFTPRVMDNWDLDYDHLKAANPSLVMVSLSGFGHSGPWRDFAALGPTVQALSGITYLSAYDKGTPDGIGLAYADHVCGLYAALAVLAALRRRDDTGEGAYIDISEYEATCSLLGPALLDYSLNQRSAIPLGNRSEWMSPHGCYRCKGEDAWCVIASSTEEEWQALCIAMQKPELADDARFSSLPRRLANYEELDEIIGNWTSGFPPRRVMNILQQAGVPCAAVNNAAELARDPMLEERGFFVELDHPVLGKITSDANPVRLNLTPAQYYRAAPLLGQDNRSVFIGMLGMDEGRFDEYISRGIIG